MSAKDKTSPFTTKSRKGMGDGVISEATTPTVENDLVTGSDNNCTNGSDPLPRSGP
jgi:hypothetical protein